MATVGFKVIKLIKGIKKNKRAKEKKK